MLTRLNGERRFDVRPSTLGTWAAPVMGMAFAFAWTPCIGPVLAVVLGLAEHNGSLAGGVLLLFAYSLGLAVPFLLAGLAFGRLTSAIARARRGLWIVEAVGGLSSSSSASCWSPTTSGGSRPSSRPCSTTSG